jgi:LytS/YehU family sensor histidine kinase
MLKYVNPIISKAIGENSRGLSNGLFYGVLISYKGTMVAATAACSIRLVKYWHLKEKRSVELVKEKTEAQLQLLKAQVHPHFLFNTLNNIYSKAQNESPGSAKMIMELSHILRYVLDEGKDGLVPLEKELQMLTDYINLEKMRYDEKLDLHLSLPSSADDMYIAPLLLLPFVENCFRQSTGKMTNDPWINLKIELNATSLMMKLMNGKKYSHDTPDRHSETEFENARKRLELLYKDRYELQINEDNEVLVVNLTLELVMATDPTVVDTPVNRQLEYA